MTAENIKGDVTVAANKLVEMKKISPSGACHSRTIVNLAELVANQKGALEALMELQQPGEK